MSDLLLKTELWFYKLLLAFNWKQPSFLLQGLLWVQLNVWAPFQDTWRAGTMVLVKGWQAGLEVDVTPPTLPTEGWATPHEENGERLLLL
jgi:hypothetical protein